VDVVNSAIPPAGSIGPFAGSGAPALAERLSVSEVGLLRLLGTVLILGLSFQNLPLPISAAISPLTSLIALLCLPVVLATERRITFTPLYQAILLFGLFVFVHSVLAVTVSVVVLEENPIRFTAWVRQVISLAGGLAVFLVLRRTLRWIPDERFVSLLVVGALPAMAVALLNVAWGLGVAPAGAIVTAVRSAVVSPDAFTGAMRATGLSFEPSYFAFYLEIIVVPALVAVIRSRGRIDPGALGLLAVALAGLGWTFSATGILIFAAMGAYAMVVERRAKLLVVAGLVFGGGLAALFVLGVSNYATATVANFAIGILAADAALWSDSALDLVYSNLGPLGSLLSSFTLIGYGLGGTATHFADLVPPEVYKTLVAIRIGEVPSLGTLFGRVLAEAGLAGLALLVWIWAKAFRQIAWLQRHTPEARRLRRAIVWSARIAIFGLLIGYLIKHASFAMPYFWVWLAYVDARTVERLETAAA